MTMAVRLILTIALLISAAASSVRADQLIQRTQESRTYLYFEAPNDAVAKLLPPGWHSAPVATGDFKGANIALVILDQLESTDASGRVMPLAGRTLVLFIPARDPASGAAGSMIVGGFASHPDNVPGPYSVYSGTATIAMSRTYRAGDAGPAHVSEVWDVVAAEDKLHLSLDYDRDPATPMHIEPRNYSAARPAFFRIYKVDQLMKTVLASETEKTNHIEFSASGPHLSAISGANVKLMGAASVPVYHREIWLPD